MILKLYFIFFIQAAERGSATRHNYLTERLRWFSAFVGDKSQFSCNLYNRTPADMGKSAVPGFAAESGFLVTAGGYLPISVSKLSENQSTFLSACRINITIDNVIASSISLHIVMLYSDNSIKNTVESAVQS